jgi:hypothetical protein
MKKFRNSLFFKPTAVLMACVWFCGSITASANPPGDKVILKAGTVVPLEFATTVTSRTVSAGSLIDFRVVGHVFVDDRLVIHTASIAKGQVVSVKKSGMLGKPGEFQISIKSVTAVDGRNVLLSSPALSAKGDGKQTLSVLLGIFVCCFCFLIHGEAAEFPAGTPVMASVAYDTSITSRIFVVIDKI